MRTIKEYDQRNKIKQCYNNNYILQFNKRKLKGYINLSRLPISKNQKRKIIRYGDKKLLKKVVYEIPDQKLRIGEIGRLMIERRKGKVSQKKPDGAVLTRINNQPIKTTNNLKFRLLLNELKINSKEKEKAIKHINNNSLKLIKYDLIKTI
jgi:hypothetical protein